MQTGRYPVKDSDHASPRCNEDLRDVANKKYALITKDSVQRRILNRNTFFPPTKSSHFCEAIIFNVTLYYLIYVCFLI
jgi:hypothetical protein